MFQNKNTHKRLAMTLGGIIGTISIGAIITIAALDTTQEIPDGEVGTIGYALKKIIGVNWQSDVNVLQSRQLGGVNGEKYLRLTGALPLGCSQADQVLQGFDMDGTNPKCVTVPTTKRPRPILATLRDLDSSCYGGKIKISNPGYSSGGTTIPPRTINPSSSDPIDLYEDDAIETTAGCSLASLYMPDNSIIRLSASTKITLRYAGIPGGSGATSTDLDGGEMWARVLKPITDDSYFNINTQEASVGVRGTSVWIQRDRTNKKTTALPIDSGKLTQDDINNYAGAIVVYPKHGELTALGTPVAITRTITVDADGKSQLTPYSTSTTTKIYQDKPFVRMATLADIKDFKALQKNVGNLATIKVTKSELTTTLRNTYDHDKVDGSPNKSQAPSSDSIIDTEISRTLPSNNDERSALCLGGDSAGTAASSPLKQWWDAVPLGRENCIESNVSFLADYSKNDTAMYWANGQYVLNNAGTATNLDNGYVITQTGKYIQYNAGLTSNWLLLNNFSALSGATITLTLSGAVGSNPVTFPAPQGLQTKFYLADFGTALQVSYNKTSGIFRCKKGVVESDCANTDLFYDATKQYIKIKIPTTPTQLIFGNNTPKNLPIGTTIQSISISPPAPGGSS